ncbi:MAG TPA: NmrA family NAD(P)-binding protein [Polyangia bacterium]|jgi:uncharacterized protein YbjT (DUF2867 family)|nr:NmrA family NAD(P)-binding protein [Polyangia bacterium]
MSIVINTPTSNIGSVLTQILVDAGEPVTLISRNPAKVSALAARGARVVEGDISDRATLDRAFNGATALFWLTPPLYQPDFHAASVNLAKTAASAAQAAGLRHAVVLSSIGAQHGRGTGPVNPLGDIERALAAAVPNTVALRAGFFMENILRDAATIGGQGAVYNPLPPDVKFPMVATRDIGARAASYLLCRSWSGHHLAGAYGPKDISWSEAARIMSQELGKPVQHVQVTLDQVRQGMTQAGMPGFVIDMYVEMYDGIIKGLLNPSEPRTPEFTTPTSLAQFTREVLRPALSR